MNYVFSQRDKAFTYFIECSIKGFEYFKTYSKAVVSRTNNGFSLIIRKDSIVFFFFLIIIFCYN